MLLVVGFGTVTRGVARYCRSMLIKDADWNPAVENSAVLVILVGDEPVVVCITEVADLRYADTDSEELHRVPHFVFWFFHVFLCFLFCCFHFLVSLLLFPPVLFLGGVGDSRFVATLVCSLD